MTNLYKFLAQYNLHKIERVEPELHKFSNHKLTRFAQRYIEIAGNCPIPSSSSLGMTDIYPDSSSTPLPTQLIKQFAIYSRRIYIHDPLLKLAVQWNESGFRNPYVYLDEQGMNKKFKEDLYGVIHYLLQLRPLIEAEIVTLVTVLSVEASRGDSVYVSDFFSPDGRADGKSHSEDLPEDIAIYADERLKCYYGKVENGHIVPIETQLVNFGSEPLLTSDKICIQFLSDPIYWPYHMATQFETDKGGKIRGFFDFRDGITIDADMFRNWVTDKKAEVVKFRVGNLWNDMVFANRLKAKFLTNLSVSRDLALRQITDDTSASSQVIKALMELELPYFENASFESISRARQNEAGFLEFISTMDEAFSQINSLSRDSTYQIKVEEIVRDVLTKPVAKINQQMRSLKRTIFDDSGMLFVGTLVAFVGLAATSLFEAAAVTAVTGAYFSMDRLRKNREEREQIKQSPGFFYWDAVRHK